MAIPMDVDSRRRQEQPLSSPCLKPGASRSFSGDGGLGESPEAELESKILRAPTKRMWGHGIG